MQRLICEWHGLDADEQSKALPKLVHDLVQLQQSYTEAAATAACHDACELTWP